MSNTAPSRADPVVVFPLSWWCPPQDTAQPHPPQSMLEEFISPFCMQDTLNNKCWPFISKKSVNSLGISYAIWRQIYGSTLAQVMACCLTAPSHYLNQCWLIISKVGWHSFKGKFTRDTSAINHWKNFPGVNELNLVILPNLPHPSLSLVGTS